MIVFMEEPFLQIAGLSEGLSDVPQLFGTPIIIEEELRVMAGFL